MGTVPATNDENSENIWSTRGMIIGRENQRTWREIYSNTIFLNKNPTWTALRLTSGLSVGSKYSTAAFFFIRYFRHYLK